MKIVSGTKPAALDVRHEEIPDTLSARHTWVGWRWERKQGRNSEWTKPPYKVNGSGGLASTTDPETWGAFEDAVEAYGRGDLDGIGICLTEDLAGVDLDDVRDPASGAIHPVAQRIVDSLNSYTELSPSGRGLRILARGMLPTGWRNTKKWTVQIEMYDRSSPRYLTVTGHHLPGTPTTVEARTTELSQLHAEVAAAIASDPSAQDRRAKEAVGTHDLGDDVLIARASSARNGENFRRLFQHGISDGEDHSVADLSLCMMLAFWTGRDATQMDRLFRRSALMRDKWDERHAADGRSYGAMTIERAITACRATYSANGDATSNGADHAGDEASWPFPQPIPDALPPVPALDSFSLLPAALGPWVIDVAERAQCATDYVAVGVVVALSAIVGRQVTMRPKLRDDWTVVPNLWGLAVGPPGVMKTAAMTEALRGVRFLIADAREDYKRALEEHAFRVEEAKAKQDAVRKQLKDAAAQGASTESLRDAFQAAQVPDAPVERRYLVNDSTVEKLGELLNQNHNGLLIFRDEIGGLLRSMEREGHENDRAFLCESWNGTGAYTYDRIGRGTQHIAACCLSVLGGIQPMPLGAYLHETFAAGQDDGLLQRFQLIAYPDVNPEWVNVDRWPDSDARRRVVELFRALDRVDHQAIGAHCEGLDLPFLRFTPEAQLRFDAWRAQLEHRLRDSGDHPAFVAHLAKYRSLVPSLALLFHLVECVDRGTGGPVSTDATDRAIAWTEYLEPHARRVYEPMVAPGRLATSTLARKMERGELASPFTVRDIRRKGWTGVAGPDANNAIFAALDQLESLAWLRRESVKRSDGGRPTVLYHINPAIVRPER